MRPFDRPGRSPVLAPNAAAATSHPLATATALSILREGGNAVDAAIAASATLCVVEPQSTGVGGDCFAIVAEPDGKLHGLNGSGRSPAAMRLETFLERGMNSVPTYSALAVTVPGAVNAWETLHRRFGRMDFARLFADAIGYARNGYPVAPRVAHDWARHAGRLAGDAGARQHLLRDDHAPAAGEIMRAAALGRVLEAIAKSGAQAFYAGEFAADIAATVQALGGWLSEEDLAAVTSDWVEPISVSYRAHEIFELPPNGQGITALTILKLLELSGAVHERTSSARLHLLLELGRLAYSLRDAEVADSDHMRASSGDLLSADFLQRLVAAYDPDRRNPAIVLPALPHSDTICLTVVDRDRLAVSFINSLYHGFGSGIVTPATGITLQNRGAGFVVETGHPNCVGPAKRPLHTIIPGMAMKSGRAAFGFGVMGGAYQPLGHAHVVSNLLDYGMDVQEAIDDPRIFWDDEGALAAESGIPAEALSGLRDRGWRASYGGLWGGAQMVAIDWQAGLLAAGSDARKDGHAAGY